MKTRLTLLIALSLVPTLSLAQPANMGMDDMASALRAEAKYEVMRERVKLEPGEEAGIQALLEVTRSRLAEANTPSANGEKDPVVKVQGGGGALAPEKVPMEGLEKYVPKKFKITPEMMGKLSPAPRIHWSRVQRRYPLSKSGWPHLYHVIASYMGSKEKDSVSEAAQGRLSDADQAALATLRNQYEQDCSMGPYEFLNTLPKNANVSMGLKNTFAAMVQIHGICAKVDEASLADAPIVEAKLHEVLHTGDPNHAAAKRVGD